MIWRYPPLVAIPVCALCLATIDGIASLLSKFIETRSWPATFSAWARWDQAWPTLVGAIGVSLVIWTIGRVLTKLTKK